MASEQQPCFVCASVTKYSCILCGVPICNRPDYSVPEIDDDMDGWMASRLLFSPLANLREVII